MSLTLDGRDGLRGKLLLDVLLHPDDGADFTLQLNELLVTDLALGSDKAQGLLLEEGCFSHHSMVH